jgi:hypothetical protein
MVRLAQIVGGGMLAQSVARRSVGHRRKIVLVTRTPKKLRRSMTDIPGLTVTTAGILTATLPHATYDTVIATTILTSEYRRQVAAIATAPHARATVDLCCTPVLDRAQPGYHHLYGQRALRVMADANAAMVEVAARARSWIEERAGGCP